MGKSLVHNTILARQSICKLIAAISSTLDLKRFLNGREWSIFTTYWNAIKWCTPQTSERATLFRVYLKVVSTQEQLSKIFLKKNLKWNRVNFTLYDSINMVITNLVELMLHMFIIAFTNEMKNYFEVCKRLTKHSKTNKQNGKHYFCCTLDWNENNSYLIGQAQ